MSANVADNSSVVVIGGGVGGLCTAIEAAARGCRVTLLERAAGFGGKMRELSVAGQGIDSGPTVMTMRWAFDQLFARAGRRLDDYVELEALEVLARHAWPDGSRLDLFADLGRSLAAIDELAGPEAAAGYREFCDYCERLFDVVEAPFLRAARPSVASVVTARGLRGMFEFASIDWHRSMWRALGSFFSDPRLRQLFGRYATYYGSSPFRAPATLNLIAHAERVGVWRVVGGMGRLADALVTLARELGATLRADCEVAEVCVEDRRVTGVRLRDGEFVPGRAVVVNAAPQALEEGRLGDELRGCVGLRRNLPRSLSAVTWSLRARTRGFPLHHHNVFFSSDYPAEFRQLEGGGLPEEPTVYICAQDRDSTVDDGISQDTADWGEPERLLVLVNAPPRGDAPPWTEAQLDELEARSFAQLRRYGLDIEVDPAACERTTPADFERLFPATGGALYGFATHAMMAPFHRPEARTRLAGLYLAGGGAHPGAGVPMVCLSGQLAGQAVAKDLAVSPPHRRSARGDEPASEPRASAEA